VGRARSRKSSRDGLTAGPEAHPAVVGRLRGKSERVTADSHDYGGDGGHHGGHGGDSVHDGLPPGYPYSSDGPAKPTTPTAYRHYHYSAYSAEIGDFGVTQTQVVTPTGTFPLRGSGSPDSRRPETNAKGDVMSQGMAYSLRHRRSGPRWVVDFDGQVWSASTVLTQKPCPSFVGFTSAFAIHDTCIRVMVPGVLALSAPSLSESTMVATRASSREGKYSRRGDGHMTLLEG
jgi:hypothetical protein